MIQPSHSLEQSDDKNNTKSNSDDSQVPGCSEPGTSSVYCGISYILYHITHLMHNKNTDEDVLMGDQEGSDSDSDSQGSGSDSKNSRASQNSTMHKSSPSGSTTPSSGDVDSDSEDLNWTWTENDKGDQSDDELLGDKELLDGLEESRVSREEELYSSVRTCSSHWQRFHET